MKTVAASAFGGAIGQVTADRLLSKTIRLKLPISENWAGNAAIDKRRSLYWAASALVALFLGMVLTLFHLIFVLMIPIGMFGAIAALTMTFLASR